MTIILQLADLADGLYRKLSLAQGPRDSDSDSGSGSGSALDSDSDSDSGSDSDARFAGHGIDFCVSPSQIWDGGRAPRCGQQSRDRNQTRQTQSRLSDLFASWCHCSVTGTDCCPIETTKPTPRCGQHSPAQAGRHGAVAPGAIRGDSAHSRGRTVTVDSRPLGPRALFLTIRQTCTRFSDSDWRGRPQSAECGGAASRRLRTLQLHSESNRQTGRERRPV